MESNLNRLPWERIRCETDPKVVFVFAKRYYKVYANIGQSSLMMNDFFFFPHTGAGFIFIRLYELLEDMCWNFNKSNDVPNVGNESGKAVPIIGAIELVVQISTSTQIVNFLDVAKLATNVILCCDFSDFHVHAIKLRLTAVEMYDGSTVLITRQPLKSNKKYRSKMNKS